MPRPSPAGSQAWILVRHAHAEWPAYRGRDFDRPLTERGLEQARATGREINTAGLLPRRILASSARRTEQTARILMDQLQLPPDTLQLLDSLYNADAATLRAALRSADARSSPVLVVAHNPGISELARMLSEDRTLAPFRPAEWCAFGTSGAVEASSGDDTERPR
jgi:phosphohistidine phosphatase